MRARVVIKGRAGIAEGLRTGGNNPRRGPKQSVEGHCAYTSRLFWLLACALPLACADSESRSGPPAVSSPPAGAGSNPAETAHADTHPLGVETTCTSDKECTATWSLYIDAEGACCRGCGTMAATPSSLEEAERRCAARGSEGCPMKKCAALEPVACIEGHCAVTDT